jgi:regulatory protein
MTVRRPRPTPRPLDESRLRELALAYVGRFATTRSKLRAYLARKLRERGWEGPRDPDLAALAENLAGQGFIDDAGYAESKARSLTARGYGRRRVIEALRGAGVDEKDSEAARAHSEDRAVSAALRFAERRRIGPFAASQAGRPALEKAIAAMVRAGHGFDLARAIATLAPDPEADRDLLAERLLERTR